jgi:hypothetical protein
VGFLGIILFKIWQTRGRLHSILFAPSLAIFLESGLIYCSLVVVLAALFFSQCAPQIVFIDLVSLPLIIPQELSNSFLFSEA